MRIRMRIENQPVMRYLTETSGLETEYSGFETEYSGFKTEYSRLKTESLGGYSTDLPDFGDALCTSL